MPRTKQSQKMKQSRDSSDEIDSLIKDFERQGNLRLHKMETEIDSRIRSLEIEVNMALSRLPSDIRKLTLVEILALESKDDMENNDISSSNVEQSFLSPLKSTIKSKKHSKRTTAISDDGYVTEGGTRQSRAATVETSKLRSRSSSKSRKTKLSNTTQKIISKTSKDYINQSKSSASKFKTPALQKPCNEFEPVTPKVKPNTPMSVLRRPRQGEMVLSMQGSPLLVSAVIQERSANVNVPLHNGDVISLLPRDGLRLSHIPSLDAETVRQLETLKGHIEKVINSK